MPLLNFAPENRFYEAIQIGTKIGTFRKKPKQVGDTLHLWEKKRGMKKGLYCKTFCSYIPSLPLDNHSYDQGKCLHCKTGWVYLPRKIAIKTCTKVIECEMFIREGFSTDLIIQTKSTGAYRTNETYLVQDSDCCSQIAKQDGFKTDKEMVSWFAKHLKRGVWTCVYWIRWD